VMANQVRPWLTNPARFNGPQQSADLIRRQSAYSIRARGQVPYTEAECMAAISTCDPESKKMLGNTGASMYEPVVTNCWSGVGGRKSLAAHILPLLIPQ
jgi:hypothetical protein